MIEWLQQHLLPCASRLFFNIDCPMCGFQRAGVLMLKGDVQASLAMYPPFIPVCILGIFFVVRLVFRDKLVKLLFLKRFAAVVLAIVMLNYVVNMFYH